MKRVIIVGSPRSNGRSAHLAEMLFEANIDERPEDELYLIPVSEIEVGPCIGCGACREKTQVIFKDDEGNEVADMRHRCVFDDDMQTLYDLLDEADELTIVSPVYFSGAPAPMKCILDRLQPYFWSDVRKAPKRPATLHVLGEGGDPHGFDALVSEVRSSTAVAGFRLERVLDWVGKVSDDGEILAEAAEVALPDLKHGAQSSGSSTPAVVGDASGSEDLPRANGQEKRRPKLSLSQGSDNGAARSGGKAKSGKPGGSGSSAKSAKLNKPGKSGGAPKSGRKGGRNGKR